MPTKKPRGGGAKLSRSETVTVRFDPKLRYLAEIAARKHRRTMSSFIEWAVELSLSHVQMTDVDSGNSDSPRRAISVSEATGILWDVDEADRFARLAFQFPDLLLHEEQVLWKLICENGLLWRGRYGQPWAQVGWSWVCNDDTLVRQRLRDHFTTFKSVASGELPRSALPVWRTKGKATEGNNIENRPE
jgi:hypothetical protein